MTNHFAVSIDGMNDTDYSYNVKKEDNQTFLYTFDFNVEFVKKELNLTFSDPKTVRDIYGFYLGPFSDTIILESYLVRTTSDDNIETGVDASTKFTVASLVICFLVLVCA